MKRWVWLVFMSALQLHGESQCYTVQLFSASVSLPLERIPEVPKECILERIGVYRVARCGCYDAYSKAVENKRFYVERYPQLMIETVDRNSFVEENSTYVLTTDKKAQAQSVPTLTPAKIAIAKSALKKYTLSAPIDIDDEQLRLMCQVFTYSSDLENAYTTAQKALKSYPRSLYWHAKVAEIAQWLEKHFEATKHLLYIFNQTHDEELEQEILDYALGTLQYDVALPIVSKRAQIDPSIKNLQDLMFLHEQVGIPETGLALMEELHKRDPDNYDLVQELLRIYTDHGKIVKAEELVDEVRSSKMINIDLAVQLSYYYSARRDIAASYQVLLDANTSIAEGNVTQYDRQISDLGWFLEEFKTAAQASLRLYKRQEARMVDYERISIYFNDPKLLQDAIAKGYQKYQNKEVFITYLGSLQKNEDYNKLALIFAQVKENAQEQMFEKETDYWLIKAQMHHHFKEHSQALGALENAIRYQPNATKPLSAYLWFLIDSDDVNALKNLMVKIERQKKIVPELWLPLGVGHFKLQHTDRALYYIDKLMRSKEATIDTKFMYAYIMQARGAYDAFRGVMKTIDMQLLAQSQKEPALLKSPTFLEHYLKARIAFVSVDTFEKLLFQSRSVLSFEQYTEIALLWALQHDAKEQAHYQMQHLKKAEPWMRFGMALGFDARSQQLDLLYRYYELLPYSDRIEAALNTGQRALAQTLAFDGASHNTQNELLYKQLHDVVESDADMAQMQGGYYDRGSVSQYYVNVKDRHYLGDGWRFLADAYFADNTLIDHDQLSTLPYYDQSFQMGMQKNFMQGSIEMKVGVRDAMKTHYMYTLLATYHLGAHVSLQAGYNKGDRSQESTYLLFGGMKDFLHITAAWNYVPSSTLLLYVQQAEFYSQDEAYLGNGTSARLMWRKLLRSAYPDVAWGAYYEVGHYEPSQNYKGIVEYLQPIRAQVLPEDYYNIGAYLMLGSESKAHYSRTWKPYLEFIPYYNGYKEALNFALNAGIGGPSFDKDQMGLGINYNQGVNGSQESVFEFYMRYRMFY